MSKSSWDEAPDWANWLAQDEDGEWYWYKAKPDSLKRKSSLGVWAPMPFTPGGRVGRCLFAGEDGRNPDWESTLEERPNKGVE